MVLLAVNLVLLAIIAYMGYVLRLNPGATQYVPKPQLVTNTVRQIAVRKINATNLLAALANRPLNWAAIESTNYLVYINNLRAFGCPEETVRDIILTDVAKSYARRRAQIRAQGGGYHFWQTSESGDLGEVSDPQLVAELTALDREQRSLVRDLLGVELEAEMAKYSGDEDREERLYGFLAPEKRERVADLQAHFDELEQQIYNRSKGFLIEGDQEALRQLQKQREAELAQVLTTSELEEYQLRSSQTAANLRAQLHGFNPSEEEFRRLFRLQKTFDDTFNNGLNPADANQSDAQAAAREQAQQLLNEEMRKTLGGDRYGQYQRVQDPEYKPLIQLTERFDVSPALAGKIVDMKIEAERQKTLLEANQNLTPEQKGEALAAVARETERSVTQLMGGPGSQLWQAYQRTGSQWIQGLGESDFVAQFAPEQPAPQGVTPPLPVQLPFPLTFPPPPVPPTLPR
jgi:hypothetical protein